MSQASLSHSFQAPDALIRRVSTVLAQANRLDAFLNAIADHVASAAKLALFRVEVSGAPGLPETRVEVANPNAAFRGARFEISRSLDLRGVRYGQVTLEVRNPEWNPAELFHFVDVLVQQIALAAETFALRSRKSQMRDEAVALKDEVVAQKAIVRAVGLLAAQRSWTSQRALDWLRQEAGRTGQPLARLASGFVEGVLVQRNVKRGVIPGFARSA